LKEHDPATVSGTERQDTRQGVLAALTATGLDRNHVDAVLGAMDPPACRCMFEAALKAAGCAPAECVVVGDSEVRDIAPAVALGMSSIRVAIETPPPSITAARAVALSLQDAARLLSQWTVR
jgi:FMN phosphatase YigB (HAD superfamily)